MARITIDDFDPVRHPNPMASVDNGQAQRAARVGRLVPYKVCVVDACGFRFFFHSLVQLELCLDYYRMEHRPSSRIAWSPGAHGDHWECQRWFEQLPLRLLEKSQRPSVVGALERALIEYSKHPSARTETEKPTLFS